MAITAKPEILTPRPASLRARLGSGAFDDRSLDLLSHLLDDFIRIPGTSIRFGLDGIVGFIPGIGDILGGLASTIIIVAAWSRGVSSGILARMVLNVAIETAAGSVPILGNLFDIGWRANRRNYALLTAAVGMPGGVSAPARRRNWLFLAGLFLVLAALLAIPLLLAAWLLLHLKALFITRP